MSKTRKKITLLVTIIVLALTLACGGVSTTAGGMDWVEQQHQRVMDNPAVVLGE
uniref:Uncharacterized protein n=1 Tax=viral metagenome TaxID=1070528 RepID=A0A6M3J3R6_9ZZZZ